MGACPPETKLFAQFRGVRSRVVAGNRVCRYFVTGRELENISNNFQQFLFPSPIFPPPLFSKIARIEAIIVNFYTRSDVVLRSANRFDRLTVEKCLVSTRVRAKRCESKSRTVFRDKERAGFVRLKALTRALVCSCTRSCACVSSR